MSQIDEIKHFPCVFLNMLGSEFTKRYAYIRFGEKTRKDKKYYKCKKKILKPLKQNLWWLSWASRGALVKPLSRGSHEALVVLSWGALQRIP